MIRTNMYFPKQIYKTLKYRAREEKKSIASLVRNFVEKGLEKKEKQDGGTESLLRMAQRAKKGSGIRDLAENHDYYLYGKGRKD